MVKLISIILVLFFNSGASATTKDPFEFKNEADAGRYQQLSNELRCMVCQNQTLADSGAGLAKDLKLEVVELINAGKSNQEVKQYLVERYGDFILFSPSLNAKTALLWFCPLLLLLFALPILHSQLRLRKKKC